MNQYTVWQIVGMASIIAVLCVIPFTWKTVITHLITLAHEYGHAFLGVFTQGQVRHIKIRRDSTGETMTMREERFLPIGSIITTLAGYPAPILLGSFLLTSVDEEWTQWSSGAFLVFGIFCLLFIRNFFGLLMALLWIAFFGWLLIFTPENRSDIMMWSGLTLMIGGSKDLLHLCVMWFRRNAESTDLGILKERTHIPQILSLLIMIAVSAVGSWFIISI